ncbi:MAG: hypothetical protein ACNS63_01720 [Candidatus Nitrospinota bacterium M3_3B_026]
MSLRVKFTLLTFAAATIAFTPAVYMLHGASGGAAMDEARSWLTDASASLETLIEERFRRIRENLAHAATGLTAKNAAREFEEAAYALAPSLEKAMRTLREDYVHKNPHPENARALLARGPDDTLYDRIHKARHPRFYLYLKKEGLEDILLIEPEKGFVVYSARKDEIFGRSVFSGELKDSHLGQAAAQVFRGEAGGGFHGFSPYGNGGALSAFIASAVTEEGAVLGVMAARLKARAVLGDILRSGLWPRGGLSAVVVDDRGERLAASDGGGPPLPQDTEPGSAFGPGLLDGADGKEWLAVYTPLEIDGLELSLAAGAPAPAGASLSSAAGRSALMAAAPAALAAAVLYIVLSRLVTFRLERMGEALRAMAAAGADLASIPPLGDDGGDEIGRAAALYNDALRSVADRVLELESRARSLARYIEKLQTQPPAPGEENEEQREKLLTLYASEAERLAETIRRQRREMEKLKSELAVMKKDAEEKRGENREKETPEKDAPPPSQGKLPGF